LGHQVIFQQSLSCAIHGRQKNIHKKIFVPQTGKEYCIYQSLHTDGIYYLFLFQGYAAHAGW
jgi:hypothetical protein